MEVVDQSWLLHVMDTANLSAPTELSWVGRPENSAGFWFKA